jgi:hypothetical protein
MGNCQAAEAATVLIQHPGGGGTERAYWALSAETVMAANPGHYVAAVITTAQPDAGDGAASSAAAPVKHLKLLRPDDTLLLGRVYRLVSFEGTVRASCPGLAPNGLIRYVAGRVRPGRHLAARASGPCVFLHGATDKDELCVLFGLNGRMLPGAFLNFLGARGASVFGHEWLNATVSPSFPNSSFPLCLPFSHVDVAFAVDPTDEHE